MYQKKEISRVRQHGGRNGLVNREYHSISALDVLLIIALVAAVGEVGRALLLLIMHGARALMAATGAPVC